MRRLLAAILFAALIVTPAVAVAASAASRHHGKRAHSVRLKSGKQRWLSARKRGAARRPGSGAPSTTTGAGASGGGGTTTAPGKTPTATSTTPSTTTPKPKPTPTTTTTSPTTTTAPPTVTTPTPPPALPSRTGVELSDRHGLALYATRNPVAAGEVTMTATDKGMDDHDLTVADGSGTILGQTPLIKAGQSETIKVTLAPGSYKLYCSLYGGAHDRAGMHDTLVVR